MSNVPTSASGVLYRDRAFPPVTWWIVAALISGMTSLIVLPVWPLGGLLVPIVICILVFFGLARLSPTVIVTPDALYAGPAHIDRRLVGTATALDREKTRWECGPGLDARAFIFIRPWIRTAVRVELDDPADPTPYWIVSSRDPKALAAAINSGSPTA